MIALRGLLLLVAAALFVIAVFSDGERYGDLLAWGLAATALGLVVEELGMNRRLGMRGMQR
ncbi:MAG: hypothetical protein WD689_09175 [Gaiellaceae bacterium]